MTATILNELISEIRVGVNETIDGKKKQLLRERGIKTILAACLAANHKAVRIS